jgi:hypothetical protein
MRVKARHRTSRNLSRFLVACVLSLFGTKGQTNLVTGGTTLTSPGAGLYVLQTGRVTQADNLRFAPASSTLSIGASDDRFDLAPLRTAPHGAMATRSTTLNGPTAWDIFPNTDSTKGAWLDVCVDDVQQPVYVPWRCVIAYATPNAYFLGVHHLDYARTPSKPLYIGASQIEFRFSTPQTQVMLQEVGMTAFDPATGRPYFSAMKADGRLRLGAAMQFSWSPTDSVYDANDAGVNRKGRGVLQVTNGATQQGTVDASAYQSLGIAGVTVTCTGPPTSVTVRNGIITAVVCPR